MRGRTQGTGALHPTLRAQRCVCVLRLGYNVRGDASVVCSCRDVAPAFGTSAMSMKSDQYRRERSFCSYILADKFFKYLDCSYFYETATIEQHKVTVQSVL